MTKEMLLTIAKITKRAEALGILDFDRISMEMDLEVACTQFDMRLDDLLAADDFNFSHDILGIQNNINRAERKIENFFVPRFGR